MGYLALAGVVFGTNLLPAFGPPTWAVLVYFRVQSDLAAVPLIVIGAISSASGRFVLAHLSRLFRSRLSAERIEHLEAARQAIAGGRRRAIGAFALFLLSPIPSAQLFVAAGVMAVPLIPLTVVFFIGRLASYTIYVSVASAARHSLGSILEGSFRSPLGIALQILMLGALVGLLRIDWARVLTRRHSGRKPAGSPPAESHRN